MSNESFLPESEISDNIVSNVKVRLGWGQNGNQRINRDAPLTLIGTNNEMQWYFGNAYSHGYVLLTPVIRISVGKPVSRPMWDLTWPFSVTVWM